MVVLGTLVGGGEGWGVYRSGRDAVSGGDRMWGCVWVGVGVGGYGWGCWVMFESMCWWGVVWGGRWCR